MGAVHFCAKGALADVSWVSDLDIWRTAHELLKHRGDDARPYATRRIAELTVAGDPAGADVWSRILAALVVLAMDRPADGVRH